MELPARFAVGMVFLPPGREAEARAVIDEHALAQHLQPLWWLAVFYLGLLATLTQRPLRERWPWWPRVEVLPKPEPIPRPTRFLFSEAYFGARILERFIAKFRLPQGLLSPNLVLCRHG